MEEIVTTEQAEHVIALLAVALPIAGLIVGALLGIVRRRLGRLLLVGLVCGLVGPAVWALWRMYDGIVGAYGLDSVRGLLTNLALFVGIGLAVGVGVGLVRRRLWRGNGEPASPSSE